MIFVDRHVCDLCGACVVVCPVDALILRSQTLDTKTSCIDCNICVKICPVECLTLGEPLYAKNKSL